jgi:hypothetical protein
MPPATCKGNPPSAKKRLPSIRRQAARGSSASIPHRQVRQPDSDQSFWPCPRDVLLPASAEHKAGRCALSQSAPVTERRTASRYHLEDALDPALTGLVRLRDREGSKQGAVPHGADASCRWHIRQRLPCSAVSPPEGHAGGRNRHASACAPQPAWRGLLMSAAMIVASRLASRRSEDVMPSGLERREMSRLPLRGRCRIDA